MNLAWRIVAGFFRFWYDFIVGDCWQLALGVAVVLGGGALLVRFEQVNRKTLPLMVAAALMALVVLSAALEWRRKAAKQ